MFALLAGFKCIAMHQEELEIISIGPLKKATKLKAVNRKKTYYSITFLHRISAISHLLTGSFILLDMSMALHNAMARLSQ